MGLYKIFSWARGVEQGVELKKERKKPSDWQLYRQKFFEV